MTAKNKGGKKPKYEIPDIAGPELSAQDRSTEKVLDFMVRGGLEEIEQRNSLDSSTSITQIPLIKEDDIAKLPFHQGVDGENRQETRKKKSLDHLFSRSGQLPKVRSDVKASDESDLIPLVVNDILKDEGDFNTNKPTNLILDSTNLEQSTSSVDRKLPPLTDSYGITNETTNISTVDHGLTAQAEFDQAPERDLGESLSTETEMTELFEAFKNRFSQILKEKSLKLCEEIFNNTIAVGTKDYFTTTSELTRKIGVQQRQCYNILSKLESLGFVNRTAIEENGRLLGIRIGLNLNPFK